MSTGVTTLSLTESIEGHTAAIQAVGELDVTTAPRLNAALRAALDDGAVTVALDLVGIDLIDSAGLMALLTARRRLRRRGGTLAITGASFAVRRVLKVCALEADFGVAA